MSQCIHRRPYPIPAQTCLFSNKQVFVTLICHFADIKTYIPFYFLALHFHGFTWHHITWSHLTTVHSIAAIAIFHNSTAPNPSIHPSFQFWLLRMFPVWSLKSALYVPELNPFNAFQRWNTCNQNLGLRSEYIGSIHYLAAQTVVSWNGEAALPALSGTGVEPMSREIQWTCPKHWKLAKVILGCLKVPPLDQQISWMIPKNSKMGFLKWGLPMVTQKTHGFQYSNRRILDALGVSVFQETFKYIVVPFSSVFPMLKVYVSIFAVMHPPDVMNLMAKCLLFSGPTVPRFVLRTFRAKLLCTWA